MVYAALILVAISVVMFILQAVVGGFTETFLLVSSDIFFRPWILVTSMFLHGGLTHLFYNMFGLALFGTILENILGKKKFLWIYFVGGVLASIGSTFLYNRALGASGAIFAVLGMLAVLKPHMRVWVSYIPMPMIMAAGVWAALDIFGLFLPSGTANLAHLVGLFFGIGMGLAWRKGYGDKFFRKKKEQVEISDDELEDWEKRWMR